MIDEVYISCASKHAWPTKASVLAHLRERAKRKVTTHTRRKPKPLEPYRCDRCGHWHTGTPK